MRAIFLLCVTLIIAPSIVRAQGCSKDASAASYALWAANTLRSDVTGTHPCGRRIACARGLVNVKGSRKCRWL
ncbi:MAG: hypothetical protein QOF14_5753 [Hyphomicrobiales bacterium]|jgi:hypothetical protein|nr:hypothetical protein [Hyphomicrobiales bacterium]